MVHVLYTWLQHVVKKIKLTASSAKERLAAEQEVRLLYGFSVFIEVLVVATPPRLPCYLDFTIPTLYLTKSRFKTAMVSCTLSWDIVKEVTFALDSKHTRAICYRRPK